MKDNDIFKAMACCSNPERGCSGCPMFSSSWDEYGKSIAKCECELIRYAFDLIKRLYKEINIIQQEQYSNGWDDAIGAFTTKVKNGCGKVKTEGKTMLVCQESVFDKIAKEMIEE